MAEPIAHADQAHATHETPDEADVRAAEHLSAYQSQTPNRSDPRAGTGLSAYEPNGLSSLVAGLAPVAPIVPVTPSANAPVEINHAVALRAAHQELHERVQTPRAAATQSAYAAHQAEWKKFCDKRAENLLVTEEKLAVFLQTHVAQRVLKGKIKGKEAGDRVGYATIRQASSAILNLWDEQRLQGLDVPGNVRGALLNGTLAHFKSQSAPRRKQPRVNHDDNEISEGFTAANVQRIAHTLWHKIGDCPEQHMRTLVDYLFAHATLSRGEMRRDAKFGDLLGLPLVREHEGQPSWALILATKENRADRQYVQILRHRYEHSCAIGILAASLFFRWEKSQESFPDFSSELDWSQRRLLVRASTSPREPFSYSSQSEWLRRMWAEVGIPNPKPTHAGPGSAARCVELETRSEDEVRRAALWSAESMAEPPLTLLPRKFMREMAGFATDNPSDYQIARVRIEPPTALTSLIWPQIDEWLQRLREAPHPDDLATLGFLSLLEKLRVVFLQDSVALRKICPQHPIWDHPVFERPEYQDFAAAIEDVAEDGPAVEPLLQQHLGASVEARVRQLEHNVTQIAQQVAEPASSQQIMHQLHEQSQQILWQSRQLAEMQRVIEQLIAKVPGLEGANELALSPTTPPQTRAEASSPAKTPSVEGPPLYRMNRNLTTVAELWREWVEGIDGGPAVGRLEENYGHKWRREVAERQYFCRRKIIIDEILRASDAQATVQALDQKRAEMRWSLHQLAANIKSASGQPVDATV